MITQSEQLTIKNVTKLSIIFINSFSDISKF